MRPFERLYLDTMILMREKWPHPSAALTQLAQICAELGVELCLPEGTEVELEENWVREARVRHRSLQDYVARIVETNRVAPTSPDWDRVRSDYRVKVAAAKSMLQMHAVPLTEHGLSDVFRLSASRTNPFNPFQDKEKKLGLQDAAIYLSIVEDLRRRGGAGAFVSDDNIYERGLPELVHGGITLKRYRDLDTVQRDLEKGLSEARQRRLDEDRHRAIEAIERRKSDLERHLNENFNPALSHWTVPGVGTVSEFTRIEVAKIQSVQTTYAPSNGGSDARVEISAEVHVLFHVRVEEFSVFGSALAIPEIPASGLPVVMSPPSYTLNIAMPSADYVLSGMIPVHLSAIFADKGYEDITFGAVGEAKDVRVLKGPQLG